MATSRATVDFIVDQLSPLPVRAKAMFGEYGLYLGDTFFALICDDTVFLKPTPASAGLAEGAPYPGAKPHPIVPAETLEDADAFKALAAATAEALPAPRPRKR